MPVVLLRNLVIPTGIVFFWWYLSFAVVLYVKEYVTREVWSLQKRPGSQLTSARAYLILMHWTVCSFPQAFNYRYTVTSNTVTYSSITLSFLRDNLKKKKTVKFLDQKPWLLSEPAAHSHQQYLSDHLNIPLPDTTRQYIQNLAHLIEKCYLLICIS